MTIFCCTKLFKLFFVFCDLCAIIYSHFSMRKKKFMAVRLNFPSPSQISLLPMSINFFLPSTIFRKFISRRNSFFGASLSRNSLENGVTFKLIYGEILWNIFMKVELRLKLKCNKSWDFSHIFVFFFFFFNPFLSVFVVLMTKVKILFYISFCSSLRP